MKIREQPTWAIEPPVNNQSTWFPTLKGGGVQVAAGPKKVFELIIFNCVLSFSHLLKPFLVTRVNFPWKYAIFWLKAKKNIFKNISLDHGLGYAFERSCSPDQNGAKFLKIEQKLTEIRPAKKSFWKIFVKISSVFLP